MTCGWVYVLKTADPALVKIGMTTRNPQARAIEIEPCRGYRDLGPFVVAWSCAVPDCAAVELAVHRMLSDRRLRRPGVQEVFRISAEDAKKVIVAASGSIGSDKKSAVRYRTSKKRRRAHVFSFHPPRSKTYQGGALRKMGREIGIGFILAVAVLWLFP